MSLCVLFQLCFIDFYMIFFIFIQLKILSNISTELLVDHGLFRSIYLVFIYVVFFIYLLLIFSLIHCVQRILHALKKKQLRCNLHDVNLLTFFKTCFMAQHRVYLVYLIPVYLKKNVYLLLLSGVFYKCQFIECWLIALIKSFISLLMIYFLINY